MHQVVILGGGKIGSLVTTLLVESGDYAVFAGDVDSQVVARLQKEIHHKHFQISAVDVQDKTALRSFLAQTKPQAVLSSLPYYCNPLVSELARESGIHYFDLTEDIEMTKNVRAVSQGATSASTPRPCRVCRLHRLPCPTDAPFLPAQSHDRWCRHNSHRTRARPECRSSWPRRATIRANRGADTQASPTRTSRCVPCHR